MTTKSERLRAARLAKGITIERAASELHVAASTYKGWEAGSEPRSLDTAARVCEYLDITMDFYVRGKGSPPLIASPAHARMVSISEAWPDDVLDKMLDAMELISEIISEDSSKP